MGTTSILSATPFHGHGDLHLAAIGRQRIRQQLHHGGASCERALRRWTRTGAMVPRPARDGQVRNLELEWKREPTRTVGRSCDRQT